MQWERDFSGSPKSDWTIYPAGTTVNFYPDNKGLHSIKKNLICFDLKLSSPVTHRRWPLTSYNNEHKYNFNSNIYRQYMSCLLHVSIHSWFICIKKLFFVCFVRSSSPGSHGLKTLGYSNSCVSLQLNVPVSMETRSLCGRSLREEAYSWHRMSNGQKEKKLELFMPGPLFSSHNSMTRTLNAVYSQCSVGKLMQCWQKGRLRQLPTRNTVPTGFQKQHPGSCFILFT